MLDSGIGYFLLFTVLVNTCNFRNFSLLILLEFTFLKWLLVVFPKDLFYCNLFLFSFQWFILFVYGGAPYVLSFLEFPVPETLGLLNLGTLATGPDNNVQYIMPSLCRFPKFFITSGYSMYHLGSKKEMLEATIHYLKSFLPRVVKIPMKKLVTTLKKKNTLLLMFCIF